MEFKDSIQKVRLKTEQDQLVDAGVDDSSSASTESSARDQRGESGDPNHTAVGSSATSGDSALESTSPQSPQDSLPTNEELKRSASSETKSATLESLTRICSSPRGRLALVAIGIIVAANLISMTLNKRSAEETQFRKYVEEAQLYEMNHQYRKASQSWISAIAVATKLGDGNKAIADLYVKAATLMPEDYNYDDIDIASGQANLRKAIALYEKTPNTTIQQIRTKSMLLYTCPPM